MLELWLIRHGETVWNRERRIQGQMNSPLSSLGVEQAKCLAKRLQGQSFDAIYASDSGRAHHTACIAFPNRDICLDKRLREMCYGVFEGKLHADFSIEEREAYLAYRRNPVHCRPPGGECWLDLIGRVKDWLDALPPEGRLIAFSHGGAIRAAIFSIIGYPTAYEWNLRFDNTGITRLFLEENSKTVASLNDTAHLELECD